MKKQLVDGCLWTALAGPAGPGAAAVAHSGSMHRTQLYAARLYMMPRKKLSIAPR